MIQRSIILFVFLTSFLGCPPIEPLPPLDDPSCQTACNRMVELSCPIAEPTPKGATCVEVCQNTLDSTLPYDVSCMSSAVSCDGCDE